MIYECRLNRVKRQHIYAGLTSIIGFYLLRLFGVRGSEYWWACSIGIALAIAVSYLMGNTWVRIEANGGTLTVEHSGMVHANIPVASIESVAMSGSKQSPKIVVFTNDGLKYFIPCECFSSNEVDQLLKGLSKA